MSSAVVGIISGFSERAGPGRYACQAVHKLAALAACRAVFICDASCPVVASGTADTTESQIRHLAARFPVRFATAVFADIGSICACNGTGTFGV